MITGEGENIRRLIALAEKALAAESNDIDLFLAGVGDYITALEEWRTKLGPVEGQQGDEETKALVGSLNDIHQRLLASGDRLRHGLVHEMGENKKKAVALRAYVDRLPQRITIAGKRKG